MGISRFLFGDEQSLSGFEMNTCKKLINSVREDILEKYQYKIATFWQLLDLNKDQIKQLHPVVFYAKPTRIHLLPNQILECLTAEQIYSILKTNTSCIYVDAYIMRKWLDTCKEVHFTKEYLEERGIPIYKHCETFPMIVESSYNTKLKQLKYEESLKSYQFYNDFNLINIRDFMTIFDTASSKVPRMGKMLISRFKVFDNCFISEELMDYRKVLEVINSLYNRPLVNLEKGYSLNEIERIIFLDYYNSYHEFDRKEVLKRIVYIFEFRKEANKMPHVQLGEKKFVYFKKDIEEYVKQDIEKNKSKKIMIK